MLSWILAVSAAVPAPPLEPEAGLIWDAPASCPDAAEVRAAVVQLAGRWPGTSEFEARGLLRGGEDHWRLQLWTRVDTHEHDQLLEARTCQGLADAAALIIAVSLDPIASAAAVELVETSPAPRPIALESIPEPDAQTQRRAEPERTPEVVKEQRTPTLRLLMGAGAGVGAGFSPGVSGGPHLSLGVASRHARFVLEGRYWAPTTAEQESGAGARVQVGTVAALGCWSSGHVELEAVACAGLEAGALRARGRAVEGASTQHFPRLAGMARMGVAWHLGTHVALTAGLDVTVSALNAIVVVGVVDTETSEIVYRTPPLGARGVVGVEFSIPVRKR